MASRTRHARSAAVASALLALVAHPAHAVNPGCFPNCLAEKPPQGWRSWNAFGHAANQSLLSAQIDALMARRNTINGTPTSLYDLGYTRVGIDDGWQACGTGVNGSFHDAQGHALINYASYPDLKGLVDYGHSKGVAMDWYKNNDGCCEAGKVGPYYAQDSAQVAAYGFDGAKFDNCGPGHNMTEWAVALNATGRPILIENCNDDGPFRPTVNPDGSIDCPYNFFRTGIDNAPSWYSMVSNLMDASRYLNLSSPGCWAYPDMLCVGSPAAWIDTNCPNASRLSYAEAQAEFGAWAVLSSPLILGFDLSNATEYDTWWPIVSNTEVIQVDQAWAGEAGRLVAASNESWVGPVGHGYRCEVIEQNKSLPAWTVWAKPLPGGAVAAIALNTLGYGNATMTITASQLGFPAGAVLLPRDLFAHADLPPMAGQWDINLGPHGSQMLLFRQQ